VWIKLYSSSSSTSPSVTTTTYVIVATIIKWPHYTTIIGCHD